MVVWKTIKSSNHAHVTMHHNTSRSKKHLKTKWSILCSTQLTLKRTQKSTIQQAHTLPNHSLPSKWGGIFNTFQSAYVCETLCTKLFTCACMNVCVCVIFLPPLPTLSHNHQPFITLKQHDGSCWGEMKIKQHDSPIRCAGGGQGDLFLSRLLLTQEGIHSHSNTGHIQNQTEALVHLFAPGVFSVCVCDCFSGTFKAVSF